MVQSRFLASLQGVLVLLAPQVYAQSTPSEFAELSLLELSRVIIYVEETTDTVAIKTPWTLLYEYKSVEFEGYLDGTRSLSFQDVLWNGPSEKRSNQNFPVVPTVIRQTVHILGLDYKFNESWRGRVSLPYINQETDHISIVPDYNFFVLETYGLGDISMSGSYTLTNAGSDIWTLSGGISFPTGSIDEVGDTPRAPGNQQLPYTMQKGSGTYDFPLEVKYRQHAQEGLVIGLSATIRTGKNDRDYRLGNNYLATLGYEKRLLSRGLVFGGVDFEHSRPISGQDDALLVDSPFPYPASITNPDLFGGDKLRARVGFALWLTDRLQLAVQVGAPVYQNLNGPQPKEQWRGSVQVARTW